MVEIERILLSSLAHASTVRSLGHAADHEAPIRTHLDEFEAVDEVLQVAQGAQHLGVIRSVARRVLNRVPRVQMVKTCSPSDHELPGFHSRVQNGVTLSVLEWVVWGFIHLN